MSRKELKTAAKAQLKGNWGWAILITLAAVFFASILTSASIGLVTGLLTFGATYAYLSLVDGKKIDNVFTGIFSAFTKERFLPSLVTSLLMELFLMFWTCLFVIPGIVKSYSYALAPYIVKDMTASGKEVAPTEAISESRKIMHGHKWQLFVLDLSFIGWAILSCITLGIGFIWLIPYVRVTHANYYRQLVGDKFLK